MPFSTFAIVLTRPASGMVISHLGISIRSAQYTERCDEDGDSHYTEPGQQTDKDSHAVTTLRTGARKEFIVTIPRSNPNWLRSVKDAHQSVGIGFVLPKRKQAGSKSAYAAQAGVSDRR